MIKGDMMDYVSGKYPAKMFLKNIEPLENLHLEIKTDKDGFVIFMDNKNQPPLFNFEDQDEREVKEP